VDIIHEVHKPVLHDEVKTVVKEEFVKQPVIIREEEIRRAPVFK
jgi:hypothetical protein